jgi:hypothetical protein
MGPALESQIEERWSVTAADTDGGGVTASKAASGGAGDVHAVTGVQCSGDAAALVTIESPASTVIWRKRFAAAFVMSEEFNESPLLGAPGQLVRVVVSAGTANSEANMQGVRLGG